VGIGVIFYSVAILAQSYFERHEKRIGKISKKHEGHNHFSFL